MMASDKPKDGGSANTEITVRDYFAANAPPLPEVVREHYDQFLKQDHLGSGELAWSGGILNMIAAQEARWRTAYADAMLRARQ
jgi:hypothetical protein